MKFRSNPNFINATLPSNLRITNLIHAIRTSSSKCEHLQGTVQVNRYIEFNAIEARETNESRNGNYCTDSICRIRKCKVSSPRIPPQGFPLAVSLSMRCRIQESRRVNDGTFESSKFASARFSRGRIQFRTLANR